MLLADIVPAWQGRRGFVAVTTTGFAPIIGEQARVLVLGTLPSRMSLQKMEYYGHPRNVFWRIMGELFGADPALDYAERTRILVARHVAVWDVLNRSVRAGSMDAAIDWRTARANDFAALFAGHPTIGLVCFNGLSAASLYRRLVAPTLDESRNTADYEILPSTSPANASMRFAQKLARWSVVRDAANDDKEAGPRPVT